MEEEEEEEPPVKKPRGVCLPNGRRSLLAR
jgi:hypothetical protein